MEREIESVAERDLKARIATAVLRKEVDIIYRELNELKDDVKIIRETLSQATGGWRLLLIIGGLSGALGAIMAKIGPIIQAGLK